MPETLLDAYFNRLKEDPEYLINYEERGWGLFHGPWWELNEDDNETRIVLPRSYRPVLGAVIVSIVVFLFASGMVWFLHKQGVPAFAYILIFSIAFLTSVFLISIGFWARHSLKKKGRCCFVWNRFQDTVSLPHRNITFSCADILALQCIRITNASDYYEYDFEVIASPNGILRRCHVFQLGGERKHMRMIRTVASRLKKPLIISGYTWKGQRVVTREDITEN
jgi:hypothetical protein